MAEWSLLGTNFDDSDEDEAEVEKKKTQENQGKRSLFAIYSGYLTAFL